MSLLFDAIALKDALTASPFNWRTAIAAFAKVLQDVSAPQTVGAADGDVDSNLDKAKAVLAECAAIPLPVGADNEPETVGKIGDGKILALLLQFMPLILKFL
jgi:hypothetical protein